MLAALLAASMTARAQEERTVSADVQARLPQDMMTIHSGNTLGSVQQRRKETELAADTEAARTALSPGTDTLHLPALSAYGQVMPFTLRPLYWGWGNAWAWNLHPGLNVNLGTSIFAQFGKHAKGGAGFTQSISALYALPVSNKLTIAVGGYFNNIMWQHTSWRDAGLTAIVGYQFNDRWEAYLYGQKSLTTNRRPMPPALYDMTDTGDRIGAAVKYNLNPNVSFQFSVEGAWMPNDRPYYFDRYNYPVPKP